MKIFRGINRFLRRIGLPNYTTTEMNALIGMSEGDIIYNSTDKHIYQYNGNKWVSDKSLAQTTVEEVTANRTIGADDNNKYLRVTASATLTPDSTNTEIGAVVHIKNESGGNLVLDNSIDVIIGSLLIPDTGELTLRYTAVSTWTTLLHPIIVCLDGGADPFVSPGQASLVPTGSYNFDIDGNAFTTLVNNGFSGGGWILVANTDIGQLQSAMTENTTLTAAANRCLPQAALAALVAAGADQAMITSNNSVTGSTSNESLSVFSIVGATGNHVMNQIANRSQLQILAADDETAQWTGAVARLDHSGAGNIGDWVTDDVIFHSSGVGANLHWNGGNSAWIAGSTADHLQLYIRVSNPIEDKLCSCSNC